MAFNEPDKNTQDQYQALAKAKWGDTPQFKEFENKFGALPKGDQNSIIKNFMDIFCEFYDIRDAGEGSTEAHELVQKLRNFISANFYTCNNDVLAGLGALYGAGGEFTANIDKYAGDGAAAFAAAAIKSYCDAQKNEG